MVKIQNPKIDMKKKEKDRQKTKHIMEWVTAVNKARLIIETQQWDQPQDWRLVTGKTLHKYIPFEINISITKALDYVTSNLELHGPPKKKIKTANDDTPIWNMSRNAIRNTIYKSSIRRRQISTPTNLSTSYFTHPVTNLGGGSCNGAN